MGQHCNTCPSCRTPVPDDSPPSETSGTPFLSDAWLLQSVSWLFAAPSVQPGSEPERTSVPPIEIEFEPGPLGIVYEGKRVVEVNPGGQTDRGGVRAGMRIDSIEGRSMPDDSRAIKQH